MKFTSKEKVKFFFTQSDEDPEIYVCLCEKERKQKVKSGYQNLLEHIDRFHLDWEHIMTETEKGSKSKLTSFIDTKSTNIYGWIDWIVAENLPFNSAKKIVPGSILN
jgi:hypothetical protein